MNNSSIKEAYNYYKKHKTSSNLFNCFVNCSNSSNPPFNAIVILEISEFSVLPTVKLSILNPLLENSPETLVSTPEEFLTKTDKTYLAIYTPQFKYFQVIQ